MRRLLRYVRPYRARVALAVTLLLTGALLELVGPWLTKIALDRAKVTLSVTSPENGLAVEELATDYGSDGLEIGFNARYLMDILHEIEGDTVEVHLADAAAPTLLRENDKSSALYVLLAMGV